MEASMIVFVMDSLARGNLPLRVSCHDHLGFGYSGCEKSGTWIPSLKKILHLLS